LGKLFRLPEGPAVEVRGAYPALEELTVDLSGAVLDWPPGGQRRTPSGQTTPGITVGRLRVAGHPVHYQEARFFVDLSAEDVRLDYDRDPQGQLLLVPAGAEGGTLRSRVSADALQALLLGATRKAARAEGIVVRQADIQVTQADGRAFDVRLRAEGTGKVLFKSLSWSVRVQARLEVNDDLVASVTGLSFQGEGALGMLLASKLEERLKGADGYCLPLTALPLGGVRVREVQLRVAERDLELEAAFGG
jgi:hypothetical protein